MILLAVNGAVGVVATLPPEEFKFFSALQDNLGKVIKGVGGLDHASWRSFSNERKVVPSRGFIDGDLIESFLELSRDRKEQVVKKIEHFGGGFKQKDRKFISLTALKILTFI